jgi:hypothetical protein
MPQKQQDPFIHFLGIRHHGPGSALRLLAYLKADPPDVLLLECPADAQGALHYVNEANMQPPVALLLYDPTAPGSATHLPFARFSPEWVALKFAFSRHIPIIAMDAPMSLQAEIGLEGGSGGALRDPFEMMARESGFTDTERWWEYFFEQEYETKELFGYICEIMKIVRAASPTTDSALNVLREAWMRRCIREAVDAGHRRVAVVCGAFHVPGLLHWSSEEDIGQAKSPSGRIATWVPWTYRHLAYESGYAAGVLSPAWYDMLFVHGEQATALWMAHCARLARAKGHPIPPSSLSQAWEMAQALSALRGMQSPGITEMEEAVLAVFFNGDPQWLIPVRDKLMIGDIMGKVPASVPLTPIQADFQEQVKKARLRRTLETSGKVQADLDLRKKTNTLASCVLHRLHLLGIPWGQWKGAGEDAKGSFRERWVLKWEGWYMLRLLDCGVWGSTLKEATHHYVLHVAKDMTELAMLSALIQQTLRARLPDTASQLSIQLDVIAAGSQDVWDMAKSLSPLAQIQTYGEAYAAAPMDLSQIIDHLIPRILVGIQDSIRRWNDDQVTAGPLMLQQLLLDLRLLHRVDWLDDFWRMLSDWIDVDAVPVYIHGAICRMMLEEHRISEEEILVNARYYLRAGEDSERSADWISGLCSGNESLLLRLDELWRILDEWITDLDDQAFLRVIPLMRRVFSDFSNQSRRQLGYLLKQIPMKEGPYGDDWKSGNEVQLPRLTEGQRDMVLKRLSVLLQLPG